MPWFYVEDTFAFHPKTVAAGNAAVGLWTRAGSWAMQTLTDGEVPAAMANTLGSKKEISALLVTGLWVPDGKDFAFHQWADRQKSRTQVEESRDAAKERQRRAREKATAARNGHPSLKGVTA